MEGPTAVGRLSRVDSQVNSREGCMVLARLVESDRICQCQAS